MIHFLLVYIPHWVSYFTFGAGIALSLLIMVFGTLFPIQYRVGGQVIATTSLIIGALFLGALNREDYWQMEFLKQRNEIARLEIASAHVTTKIVTEYSIEKIVVKEKGREIIKKVPVYITRKNDDNCVINNGFTSLHDSAAKNEIPNSPSNTNDSPSGITLSEVGATVAENYNKYHELAQQTRSLQAWITEQGAVHEKEKEFE